MRIDANVLWKENIRHNVRIIGQRGVMNVFIIWDFYKLHVQE